MLAGVLQIKLFCDSIMVKQSNQFIKYIFFVFMVPVYSFTQHFDGTPFITLPRYAVSRFFNDGFLLSKNFPTPNIFSRLVAEATSYASSAVSAAAGSEQRCTDFDNFSTLSVRNSNNNPQS